MREYKRKHRELSAGHRAKISRAMRGKKKSSLTKKTHQPINEEVLGGCGAHE